jgi:hypothetical protein
MTDTHTDSVPEPTRSYVQGLREYADFIEAHPEFTPFGTERYFTSLSFEDDPKAALARFASLPGKVEKRFDDDSLRLERHFGPHVFTAFATRAAVCEKVEVGSEVEEVYFEEPPVPPDAEEILDGGNVVGYRRTKTAYEWRCEPLLAPESPGEGSGATEGAAGAEEPVEAL